MSMLINPYRFEIPDTYAAQVVAQLHFDGASSSRVFNDVTGRAWAPYATCEISSVASKFGGTSGYFAGGAFISALDADDLNPGGNDFTIEAFVRVASLTSERTICAKSETAGSSAGYWFEVLTTGALRFRATSSAGVTLVNFSSSAGVVAVDTWCHVAISRVGNAWYLLANGSQVGTTTVAGSIQATKWMLNIGRQNAVTGRDWKGYIDEFRFTNGVGRYSGSYTVPTAAFSDAGIADHSADYLAWSATILQLHFDGAYASTTMTDSSPYARAATVGGGAQIDTAQSKFGGASLLLDGSGDYVTWVSTPDLELTSGDFTIEFWCRLAAGTHRVLATRETASAGGWMITITTGTGVTWDQWTSGATNNSATGPSVAATTWAHVAIVRAGSNVTVYVDGVGGTPLTTTNRPEASTNALSLGRDPSATTTNQTNGHIDDLRIRAYAVYTADFTPPASAHPDS